VDVGRVLNNPTIGLKLDPGEPGIAGSAPASTSALKVIPHELANIRSFEAEARAKGGVVIDEEITLDIQRVGSYLTVAGGHSKAVILYSKDGRPVLAPDDGSQANPQRPATAEHLPQDGSEPDKADSVSLLGESPKAQGEDEKNFHLTPEERRNPEYNEALRDPEESEDARVEQREQAMNPNPILLQGEEARKGTPPPASLGMGKGLDLLV
jgi:hypothetical protein